jgi:hypothetical protein
MPGQYFIANKEESGMGTRSHLLSPSSKDLFNCAERTFECGGQLVTFSGRVKEVTWASGVTQSNIGSQPVDHEHRWRVWGSPVSI